MSAKEKKDNSVYVISMVIMLLAVGWGFLSPASFGAAANNLFNFLIQNFGWGYMLFMTFFVIFPIGLAISKYGKLKLGPADSKPEFRDISFGLPCFFPQAWVWDWYFTEWESRCFIFLIRPSEPSRAP